MIAPAKNAPCHDCECNIGVKQPKGTEEGEFLYCDAFKKIPLDIASGVKECPKQKKVD